MRAMENRGLWLASGLVALVLVALPVHGGMAISPTPAETEPELGQEISVLQAEFGLSADAATHVLADQLSFGELVEQLRQKYSQQFASSTVDYTAVPPFSVAFTGHVPDGAVELVEAKGIPVLLSGDAAISESTLEATRQRIYELLMEERVLNSSTTLDTTAARVLVTVPTDFSFVIARTSRAARKPQS